jgi:uncharacterized membrane protein (DUF2068 family)
MWGSSDRVVRAIGAFKLAKAALLIGVALLAFRFAGDVSVPSHPARTAGEILGWLGAFPGRPMVVRGLNRLFALDGREAEELGLAAVAYAVVFVVEGVGLLLRKRWAEWLTVVVTGSFIPIEVWEMIAHFGAGKVVALVLNVVIVIYLVARRLRERRQVAQRIRRALA